MSHGQATRSTWTCDRVTHFIVCTPKATVKAVLFRRRGPQERGSEDSVILGADNYVVFSAKDKSFADVDLSGLMDLNITYLFAVDPDVSASKARKEEHDFSALESLGHLNRAAVPDRILIVGQALVHGTGVGIAWYPVGGGEYIRPIPFLRLPQLHGVDLGHPYFRQNGYEFIATGYSLGSDFAVVGDFFPCPATLVPVLIKVHKGVEIGKGRVASEQSVARFIDVVDLLEGISGFLELPGLHLVD